MYYLDSYSTKISFGNSNRAAYSDRNPDDRGQSLHPMSAVLGLSFFGRYFALGRLSAFSWQIFGTYLERKKELADFWNLVFVFLLKFETNFGGKFDENQPKKCSQCYVAKDIKISSVHLTS